MTLSPDSFIGCLAYGYELTPWACIQNQLGLVLEVSPCWDCKRPVTIELPKAAQIIPEIFLGSAKPRRTWPQGMSKAVARSLGLV